jgi:hypothetical protein
MKIFFASKEAAIRVSVRHSFSVSLLFGRIPQFPPSIGARIIPPIYVLVQCTFAHATDGFQNYFLGPRAAFGSISTSLGGYLNAGLLH